LSVSDRAVWCRTNQLPLIRPCRCARTAPSPAWDTHGFLARRNDESDGRIAGENGGDIIEAIISIAYERSWSIGHLLRQWPDMRGVVDFPVGHIESGDFVLAGGDADMKLAPGPAFRSPVFFEKPFARSSKLQSPAADDQMLLQNVDGSEPAAHKPGG
jgi:hypothetical protein